MNRGIWFILGLCLATNGILAESPADIDDGVVENEDGPADTESIENIDVNQFFKDGKIPTQQELSKILDSMKGLSDDDKKNLKRSFAAKAQMKNIEDTEAPPKTTSGFLYQTMTLLGMLSIIGCIFSFFGYKLYKSLVDRELKREMKRKLKESKKKK
ncbi:hypothetical protein HCN44_003275 [Aphidius gifuensis]|uniref:Uncharacterized protein n=1 Tax=Aphidius gifuensis TaxID=684658 RepID=A0A835CMW4_APHGI|nr:uncharacterized protein LOC122859042 [Aphidius gifuensis]XP_044018324.1 uncharacterized protein LOC122859042 [Aphidius gifuensis]KAF7987513.1 hypothetical protein HCN44_003275 [Aphidius gifuensis]